MLSRAMREKLQEAKEAADELALVPASLAEYAEALDDLIEHIVVQRDAAREDIEHKNGGG